MINITKDSLKLLEQITYNIQGQTFHHHHHILLDIANSFNVDKKLVYMEIGAYAGASACLMMNRPNTDIISIDLGNPISPQTVCKNVWNHNKHGNNYTYIVGNSQDKNTFEKVKNVKTDILFIDGDHSYLGVWKDFLDYSSLVNPNGYIIFDDYNDFVSSPMVKSAVDHIVNQVKNEYEIIGTFKNVFNARGLENTNQLGNCFVIKKLQTKTDDINFAVGIVTYRKNNDTIINLEKTLDSVFNQTYQNYKVFLIGDAYDNIYEIENLVSKYPNQKIYFENLPFSRERKFHKSKRTLWRYGGCNSANYLIDLATDNNYSYIAHLDHDDIWTHNHLEELNDCIKLTGADFVCTRGKTTNGLILPIVINKSKYFTFYPIYNSLLHSSVCMNFSKIPLRYRDLWLNKELDDEQTLPGDGDMWERCRKYMLKNNLRSFCVNTITVGHETENT